MSGIKYHARGVVQVCDFGLSKVKQTPYLSCEVSIDEVFDYNTMQYTQPWSQTPISAKLTVYITSKSDVAKRITEES